MTISIPANTLEKFTTFGDLLRFLRRRMGITQTELAIAVSYSHTQISRLEQNLRLPDIPTIEARFVTALGLEDEPRAVARLLELAANVRREDAPALGLCPYRGLNYFDESDADLFVGREVLTAKLVERVLSLGRLPHETRFLAVVGASGSGKSSLVRAGLVYALRWHKASTDWHIHVLTPTAHPLESLATTLTHEINSVSAIATLMDDLARDSRSLQIFAKRKLELENNIRLLLVIDQFEELFALCRSEEERASFIENLLTASSEPEGRVIIVITLRADFYAHCANYVHLREALAKNQEYIGAMNDDEIRRVIEEPAGRGRWEFEPGLVDLLLHEVGHEPGALPLLSHALFETWQRRRGRVMTLGGYASSGGVRGAIAETAEAVFIDQFTNEQRSIARKIFLRLTELGDETSAADTRRRATFNELILKPEEAATTHAVLKALADARLIVTSEDSAEVAHEALIREWPTLRGWLEENREGLRLHRQLTEAAQEWNAMNRSPDILYRGARLAQAREWAATHKDEMNALEHEFLSASIEASEREVAERESQRQRELEAAQKLAETQSRAAKQLHKRAIYLTGAFIIALTMAFTALFFGERARQSAVEAQTARRIAISHELAAASLSNLNVDPERSILLALQAVATTYDVDKTAQPQAEDTLHRAVISSRALLTLAGGHTLALVAAEYSPDGARIATGGQDGIAKIWDADAGKELLTLQDTGPDNAVNMLAYSPDGARVATANDDGTVKVWDTITGRAVMTLTAGDTWIDGVAYSPDGTRLVSSSGDGVVKMWDAVSGMELHMLRNGGHSGQFSPDGKRFATAGDDNVVIIRDVASGNELIKLSGHTASIWKMTFSPDGARVATVSDDGTARVWNVSTALNTGSATGEQELLLNHSSFVASVAFSPDGKRLATGGGDGTARVWDATSGKELIALFGHTSAIFDISFSPDGTRLATGGWDATAKVWDLTPSHEFLTFTATDPGGWISTVTYSPDGKRLATTSDDNAAKVWDASSGKQLLTLSGHAANVNAVIFSPDGTKLATVSDDTTAKIWDAATGRELLTLKGHSARVVKEAFNADGTRLATASHDNTARVWDALTGKELLTLSGHTNRVDVIAFSPDGNRIATASRDKMSILWDASSGHQLFTITTPQRPPSAIAFSPDGRKLVVAFGNGTFRVFVVNPDASQAKELFDIAGHAGLIEAVTFSPDGKRFATASDDNTVNMWDAATGQEVLTLIGHTGGVDGVAFSPDGTRLATASRDGTVRVYLLQLEELIALAKSRVTRSLTTEECHKYLRLAQCPSEP